MATANELRQILKEDAAGKNLYDHLTETLMRIVIDRPANAYDAFELISADIKANPLDPSPETGKSVPPSEAEVSIHCRTTTNKPVVLGYWPSWTPFTRGGRDRCSCLLALGQ